MYVHIRAPWDDIRNSGRQWRGEAGDAIRAAVRSEPILRIVSAGVHYLGSAREILSRQ